MPRKILVAYDFNSVSERALRWACELVREVPGNITLLHVVLLPPPAIAPDAVIPLMPPPELEAAPMRDRLRAVAQRHGLPMEAETMSAGHVGAAVVERARELGADLVVLGTHGRGMLARAFLGSTANHVVRHADCPVVTVREPTGHK